jgi:serine/threonine protein kinase
MKLTRDIEIIHDDEELFHLKHPPTIDDALATKASEAARLQIQELQLRSRSNSWPLSLSWKDIRIQRKIRVGGSGVVSLVRVTKLDNALQSNHWYALKCLNKKTMSSSDKDFVKGVRDLNKEAAILSRLSRHRNIIQIHGVLKGNDPKTFRQPGGYFLVLQCLKRNLGDLLNTWRREDFDPAKIPSVEDRISNIALGVANGMNFLHENRIIYRDLKPHNVGIDYEGYIKIFDFGSATVLPVGTNSIGGCLGSLNYMAPETLTDQRSYFSSDVYAFAILLWQLVTLDKPYCDAGVMTLQQYRQKIGTLSMRPMPLPENDLLAALIQECWHSDHVQRPTFAMALSRLEQLENKAAPVVSSSIEDGRVTLSKVRRFSPFALFHSRIRIA